MKGLVPVTRSEDEVPSNELPFFIRYPKYDPCDLSHEFKLVWIRERSRQDFSPQIIQVPAWELFVGQVLATKWKNPFTSKEKYIENSTWARVDMEFLLECLTRRVY